MDVVGIVEDDRLRPIADLRLAGEDPEFAWFKRDGRLSVLGQVEAEGVVVVAVRRLAREEIGDLGFVDVRISQRAGLVLLEAEFPTGHIRETYGGGIGRLLEAAAGCARSPGHADIEGIVDDHDGLDVDPDIDPLAPYPIPELTTLDLGPIPVPHLVHSEG